VEIALDIQQLNSNIPLIVRVFDRYLADRAERQMRVRKVLSPALLTAPVFVAAAQGQEMVRAFEIGSRRFNVLHLRFLQGSPGVGRTAGDLCLQYNLLLLAMQHPQAGDKGSGVDRSGSSAVSPTPSGLSKSGLSTGDCRDIVLEVGDELIAMASEE